MAAADIEAKFKQVLAATWGMLKAAGYRKRGACFRLGHGSNVAIIDFQRSQDSNADALKFTINLGIVSGALVRKWDPERDPSKEGIWAAHLRERIGFLIANDDRWWTITSETPVFAIEAEILEVVEICAIPFLERHANDIDLVALWRTGRSPGLTEGQRARNLALLEDAA